MRDNMSPPFPARLHALAQALRALFGATARRRPATDTLVLNNGRNDGPPDLDELWRDFNRKLSGLFGGKGGGPRRQWRRQAAGWRPVVPARHEERRHRRRPDRRRVTLIWLGSGFFIVQEGQQAVITTFGKYSHTKDAGFQWRFPYPVQAHETVAVTQLRSVEVGRNTVCRSPACATRRCSPRTRTSSTSASPCSTG
jgi:modulator of FtsH protease HflK